MSCEHRRRHPGPPSPPPASNLHGNGVPRPQMNELQRRREERARSISQASRRRNCARKGVADPARGGRGRPRIQKDSNTHSYPTDSTISWERGRYSVHSGTRSFGSDVLGSQGSPLPSSTLSLRHLSSAPQTAENRTSCGLAPLRGG